MSEVLIRLGITKEQVKMLLHKSAIANKEQVQNAMQGQAKAFPDSYYEYKNRMLKFCKNKALTGFEIAKKLKISKTHTDKIINALGIPVYEVHKDPITKIQTRRFTSNGHEFLPLGSVPKQTIVKSRIKPSHLTKILELCNGVLKNIHELAEEMEMSYSAVRIVLKENDIPYILKPVKNRVPEKAYISDGKEFKNKLNPYFLKPVKNQFPEKAYLSERKELKN